MKMDLIAKYRTLPIPVKASLWFLMCSFLQKAVAMLTTPIFTRLLSSAEYGQYNVFNSWLSILSILITFNLSAGVYTQGLVKFEKQRSVFSSSLQGLTLLLAVFWGAIFIVLESFWSRVINLSLQQVVLMFIIIWTNSVFAFWASEQRVDYKYRKLVIITVFATVCNPLLGIVLVLISDDKVTARIFSVAIVQVLFYMWCFFSQVKKGKVVYSKTFWGYVLKYNIPLIPHYFSQIILNNSDRIMIDGMVGSSQAGIYSLAYSIAMIVCLFSQALTQTLNPWFYKKIKDKDLKDVERISYISLGVVAVATVGLILFAPEIVAIFAPKQYLEAVYCIPPVAIGMFFLFSFEIFGKFAFYYERTKYIMLASLCAAVVNVILNFIGIKLWGYIAAAYTTLLCYILFSIFHYLLMQKVSKECMDKEVPLNPKVLLGYAISVLGIGFFVMGIYKYLFIRYIFVIIFVFLMILFRKRIKSFFLEIFKVKKEK